MLLRAALCIILLVVAVSQPVTAVKNVLFLVSDDLRPELNVAYGKQFVLSPNLDKLAGQSVVFDRAYTNFAICSASRNSFMTGRMPDTVQVWNFINNFRQSLSWNNDTSLTLPQYFKSHGYLTLGAGKLYHPNHPPNNDEPYSWSPDRPYYKPYIMQPGHYDWDERACGKHGPASNETVVCVEPTPSNATKQQPFNELNYADYNETLSTINNLRYAAQSGRPFFIGLGVTKPHQPWHVPEAYYRHYMDLPIAAHTQAPTNVPDVAFTAEFDGQNFITVGDSRAVPGSQAPSGGQSWPLPWPGSNTIPKWAQQALRAGYYSAVSLADHHLGMVLDELDALGLTNDTLVVMTSDHGYQLGEHSEYAKHTNFELATHIPMMIRAPWLKTSGQHAHTFIELVDLYRTVASLAGLPPPPSSSLGDVQGMDMSGVVANASMIPKHAAFSQYSRCPHSDPSFCKGKPDWCHNNCEQVQASDIGVMGYTVRTPSWRYTEWLAWDGNTCQADWDNVVARELYSHAQEGFYPIQFDCCENDNVAANPEHATVVQQHHELLIGKYKVPTAPIGCPV